VTPYLNCLTIYPRLKKTLLPKVVISAAVLLMSQALFADTWTAVQGSSIDALLSGRGVVYEGASQVEQVFHADGSTTYVQGRPSVGQWKVSETRYCSQWPPIDSWSCYFLSIDESGERIRFVGESGQQWIAKFNK